MGVVDLCQLFLFSIVQRRARYPKNLELVFEDSELKLYPGNDFEYYALKESLKESLKRTQRTPHRT